MATMYAHFHTRLFVQPWNTFILVGLSNDRAEDIIWKQTQGRQTFSVLALKRGTNEKDSWIKSRGKILLHRNYVAWKITSFIRFPWTAVPPALAGSRRSKQGGINVESRKEIDTDDNSSRNFIVSFPRTVMNYQTREIKTRHGNVH